MSEAQQHLYGLLKRNSWARAAMQNHRTAFTFHLNFKPYAVTYEELRYVLARLTLEGVGNDG